MFLFFDGQIVRFPTGFDEKGDFYPYGGPSREGNRLDGKLHLYNEHTDDFHYFKSTDEQARDLGEMIHEDAIIKIEVSLLSLKLPTDWLAATEGQPAWLFSKEKSFGRFELKPLNDHFTISRIMRIK